MANNAIQQCFFIFKHLLMLSFVSLRKNGWSSVQLNLDKVLCDDMKTYMFFRRYFLYLLKKVNLLLLSKNPTFNAIYTHLTVLRHLHMNLI